MRERLFNILNIIFTFLVISEAIRKGLGILFFPSPGFLLFFNIFLLGITIGTVYLVYTKDKWGYVVASVLLVKGILGSLLSPWTLLFLVMGLILSLLLLREVLAREELEEKVETSKEMPIF